jgi:SAM-dependent methyltransferase
MMNDERREMFAQRYESQQTPWDTGITPPEIVAIAAELPPGRALDLGCGTGTNVRYMLERGWEADGIDFVPQAVDTAHRKLADFPQERFGFFCHDVTRLDECSGLRAPYTLVIDIGCGHGVPTDQEARYAHDIATLLAPGGTYMLYAHHPTEDHGFGWTPDGVRRIFSNHFTIVWQKLSDDTTNGRPSGWYRMVKKG